MSDQLRDLELIHYSARPLRLQSAHPHPRSDRYFKPIGLWVSVRGPHDWKEWCESEGFSPDGLNHETRIVLAEDANILWLRDEDDIDRFTAQARLPPQYSGDRSIDWPRVAQDYDGIIIAPYCWARRMTQHTFWYYGWDCASGCIWNMNAILATAQEGCKVLAEVSR